MEMEMDFDSISNLENRQKTLFKIKQSKLEAGGSGCAATAFFSFWVTMAEAVTQLHSVDVVQSGDSKD